MEEHFYLLLPLLILVLMRRPSAGKTVAAIASVVLLGIGLRAWELFHVLRAAGLTDEQVQVLFMKEMLYRRMILPYLRATYDTFLGQLLIRTF